MRKQLHDVNRIKMLTQADALLEDLSTILAKTATDVKDADTLYVLTQMPFNFYDAKTDITFSLEFASASGKININNILDTNETISQFYFDTIKNLFDSYQLEDSYYLMSLISDSIDKDLDERLYSSEMALKDKKFKNGRFENFDRLMTISDQYFNEREDDNIYKVPWKEIFDFNSTKTDINYISRELLLSIFPEIYPATADEITKDKEQAFSSLEDLKLSDEQTAKLQEFGFVPFVGLLQCRLSFFVGDDGFYANFVYDIKDKSIRDVAIRFSKNKKNIL